MSYTSVEKSLFSSQARDPSQIQCTSAQIDSRICRAYFRIIFGSGGAASTVTRTYKGWLETMGDVGGLKEVTIFAFGVLYWYFHNRRLKEYMIFQVFRLVSRPKFNSKQASSQQNPSQALEQ